MSPPTSFPITAKLLHWICAILIISMLFLGVTMIQSLAIWHSSAIKLHQSFGVIVLCLVAVRLLNRLFITVPALPPDLSALQHFVAKASQVLMYVLMLALPISGWLMRNGAGLPVSFFGILDLPILVAEDIKNFSLFREAHAVIAWSLFEVIVLHISAALHHGFIRQDGVLAAMWFRLRSPK